MSWIDEHESEIAEAMASEEETITLPRYVVVGLVEALEYYGDRKSWSKDHEEYDRGFSRWCILYGDTEEINDSVGYSGWRARTALATLKGCI